ncbi:MULTISPECIES: DUF3841 domain-containing protein [Metasolibacillus]|uniref:DUF3841 domain-containing protein n=1 Tax=Metasolibacillus TaxID=2703677 RepID=UPI000799C866|nr:DUF3841 domain-containing protein [Metasolibacillus fluoroglycofenilyticus]KYG92026.1 hypothetical protein A0U40_03550 [[Bacillus] sp. KCTC 13219]
MSTYWTIQSEDKWKEIQEKGCLIGNPEFIYPEFVDAYNWLKKRMKEKLPNYNNEYPIWLWIDRPDLRKSGHLEAGEKGILLKIDIEDNRVLLSDFQAWHFVLNKSYFDLENIENDNSDYTQFELEKSWELIFDIDYLARHPNWGEKECTLQGVTNHIKLNEISLVKKFTAR